MYLVICLAQNHISVCVLKVLPLTFILIVEHSIRRVYIYCSIYLSSMYYMALANVLFPYVSAYFTNIHMQHDTYYGRPDSNVVLIT